MKIKSIFESKEYSDVKITSITSYNGYNYGKDTYLLEEVCKRGTGRTFVGIVYKNDNYLPKQLDLLSPEKKTDDEYFVPDIIYQKSEDCRYAFSKQLTENGYQNSDGVHFTKSLVQSAKLFEWFNYQGWLWSEVGPWSKLHKKKKVRVA